MCWPSSCSPWRQCRRSAPRRPLTRRRRRPRASWSSRRPPIPWLRRFRRQRGPRARAAERAGVDATEDAGAFTASNLRRYRAVVFLLTTGDVLNEAQQAAFERFVRGGGGLQASTRRPTRVRLGVVRPPGQRFRSHPQIQRGDPRLERRSIPRRAGCRRTGFASTSGTTSRAIRGRPLRCSRGSTRRATRPEMGRWAPTIRSRGAFLPGRTGVVHRRRPHRRVVC